MVQNTKDMYTLIIHLEEKGLKRINCLTLNEN